MIGFTLGFLTNFTFFLQILRLFSESAESIAVLKVDLADAKKLLGARSKQLHQLWYRSVTLRHIISLLDQLEGIAKVGLLLFLMLVLLLFIFFLILAL